MNLVVVLSLVLVALVTGQYVPRPPRISLLQPVGLRMAIPHEEGISLFAVHYSVNKPVRGVAPGDWNFDTRSPTGNEWVHENRQVIVKPGDTVYYWIYVLHRGVGYQLLEQSWLAGTATRPTPPRTDPPPTNPPPTNPPQTNPPPTNPPPSVEATTRGPRNETKLPGGGGGVRPEANCVDYPCLIFKDDFDSFDFKKWKHEITAGGGGNWEFQYYTNNRSNSYVRDGKLFIKPTLTSDKFGEAFLSSGQLNIWGHNPANQCTGQAWYGCERQGTGTNYVNPIQSARLRTAETFNFRYGRVEVSARMPQGDWIWPAIWLLPTDQDYGDWPASGEIDIVESRGNQDLRNPQGVSVGNDQIGSTLHFGPFPGFNGYENANEHTHGNFAETFHTYRMDWDENSIEIYIDEVKLLDVRPGTGGMWEFGGFDKQMPSDRNPWVGGGNLAPFDREFYLIMNVAVGGTGGYFSDADTNAAYPKPWLNTSPTGPRDFWNARDNWYPTWVGENAAMQVEYVRVYKLQPDPQESKN